MRLPLRSWKETLSTLGLRWVQKSRPRKRRSHTVRLGIESLEQRQMLSGTQVDNDDADFSIITGSWGTVAGGVAGESRYADSEGSATAQWSFDSLTPGQYRISATWAHVSPDPVSGVVGVEAELTQGWPTDESDPSFAVAQVGAASVVRDVSGTRENAETFEVTSQVLLDKIWVQYASRFNDHGFRVVLYAVDDPLAETLTTPTEGDPDIIVDDTVEFGEITGAVGGISGDADKKFMAIDVDDVELVPGTYALQFFSTDSSRTFKWVEQYGSDVGGDRYDGGDLQTDDASYRFALETSPAAARSSAASFEVFSGATSLGTVHLDQSHLPNDLTESGTRWEDLGTFAITATTASVELQSSATSTVIADAIRLERIADLPLTVTLAAPYANEASGTLTGTVTRAGSTSGNLVVSLSSSDTSESTVSSTVTILDGNASANFTITLQDDSIFDGNQPVHITATASDYASSQAGLLITDEGESKVIDDGDTGFAVGGTWTYQSSPSPAGYQTDIHLKSAGSGSNTATWTFSSLTAGTYRVSATWTANTDRATNATYSVYDAGANYSIDQTTAPAADIVVSGKNFQNMGIVTVVNGTLSVVLTDNANGKVVADAIRIESINLPTSGANPSLAMPRDLDDDENQGIPVMDLVGQAVSNIDPQYALGIALIATDDSHGALQFSLDDGETWDDVGTVSASSSLLIPADGGRVRLVPDGPFLGTVAEAITFRSWNGAGGDPGDLVDTSIHGPGTAFGARTTNLAIQLTPAIGTAERLNRFRLYYASTVTLAVAGNGDYVAVWDGLGPGGYALRGQWFTRDGAKLGAEFTVGGAAMSGDVSNHAVAVIGDNALVVWSAGIDDPDSGYGIRAQLFDRDGNAVDDPWDVSDATSGVEFIVPHVAPHDDGSFVVTWQGTDANSISGIFARQYDAAGDPLDEQFLVADAWPGATHSVSATPDGGFAVTGWDNGIVILRYDDEGESVGSPMEVSSGYIDNPNPALAVDGTGRFIVAWKSGTEAIHARRFESDGSPLGGAWEVDHPSSSQLSQPTVAADAEGNFVIAWESRSAAGLSQGIASQWFDSSGNPLYEPRLALANAAPGGVWEMPAAAGNAAGDVVVAWTVRSGSALGDGIFAQRFRNQHAPTSQAITDITIQDPFTLDLGHYFADFDTAHRDSLTFTVESNDAPTIVDADIDGSELTLGQGSAHTAGDAEITIRATDATGRYAEQTLTVAVSLTGHAPAVAAAIADVAVDEDADDNAIDLSEVFDDADVSDTLTYSVIDISTGNAHLSNSVPLSASISGDTLTLDYLPDRFGTVDVTIRATDSAGYVVEDTFTVTVSPVNDAPILAPVEPTQPLDRSATLVSNTGLSAAELLKDVRDPDLLQAPDSSFQPSLGLAITDTDESRGTWQYSLEGVGWSNVGAVSATSALLLPQSAHIRFRPSGPDLDLLEDALTFHAWDGSSGAAGTKVDASETGGTTSLSDTADALSISLTPATGNEVLLATGDIGFSTAAVNSDGSYMVAWLSSNSLHTAHFAADGTPIGTPYPLSGVWDFATGADGLGHTLLVWSAGSNVLGQWFGADGEAIDDPVVLQSSAGGSLGLAMGADGSFVLVWNQYASNGQVWARRFEADGMPDGSAFMVNSDNSRNYSVSGMGFQAVSIDGAGGFVVAFNGTEDYSSFTTYVRRFDASGAPVDDQAQAGESVDRWWGGASVGTDAEGNFVVGWQGNDAGGHLGRMMARRFDADMVPLGDEFVASAGANAWLGSVAMNPQGRFVAMWYGQAVNDDEDGMAAQSYTAAGTPIGAPVLLNAEHGIVNIANWATLAAGSGGQFVAAWTEGDVGQNTNRLYSRRLQLPQPPTVDPGVSDVEADEDDPITEIDLDEAFRDGDVPYRDWLTYTVVANDTPTLVTPSIDGGRLLLNYAPNQNGVAEITVRATDWFGYSVEDTFLVTVDPVNDAPTGGPLPGILLTDTESFSIDLTDYFRDLESDAENLTLSIHSNSNSGLFSSILITDGVLSGEVGEPSGSATITIRATDPGSLYGDATITIGAYEPDTDLESSGGGSLISIPWGLIDDENSGELVSDLIAGLVNTSSPTGLGMAIYNVNAATLGDLQYSLDSGETWQNVGAVSPTAALLLPANEDTRLRFLPLQSPASSLTPDSILSAATSILDFVGWNGSVGTAGETLNLTLEANQSAVAAVRNQVNAQQTMANMEFIVNTATTGEQFAPRVAMAPDGRSVAAWIGGGPQGPGVYAQRFNPDGTRLGGQFFVHGDSSAAVYSHVVHDVAIDSGDTFVVVTRVWGSTTTTKISRYDWITGDAIGSPITFTNVTTGAFFDADMAGDRLVVVRTLASSIVATVYDADQTQLAETTIDSATTGTTLGQAAVAMAADETFVVAWNRYTSSSTDLHARRYSFSGTSISTVAADQLVKADITPAQNSVQLLPLAEMNSASEAVVSWYEDTGGSTANRNAIWLAVVGGNGVAGTPVELDGTAFALPIYYVPVWPAVHVQDDGKLFVAGTVAQDATPYNKVVGQYYEMDGDAIGAQFDLASLQGRPDQFPVVAGSGAGTILAVWEEYPWSGTAPLLNSRDGNSSAVIARFIGPQATPAYSVDSDSVGFKPLSIYTRPISVEVATGHVVFHPDRGPDGQGDGILPVYRQTSDIHPIVSVDYVLPTGQTLPDLLEVKLTFGGIENAEPVFYSLSGVQGGTAGLPSSVIRLVLQADDVSALPTGRYNYQVEVIEHRGEEESDPKLLTGAADIVNRRESEFGVGWWLDSLDRIVTGADGYYDGHDGGGNGVLLVRGDGTTGWFAENSDGGYDSPAGSFTTLVKNIGGDFTLTHTDGTVDEFDADGLLQAREDRNGNRIVYDYDDVDNDSVVDELVTITDIYGLPTTYEYDVVGDEVGDDDGKLDLVRDFAGRETVYTIGTTGDTTGYVNKITETDPDGGGELAAPETDFTYYVGSSWDGDLFQGLLYTITTPGIQTQSGLDRPSTTISYGAAGRFESAVSGDETAWELTPAQIAGLATGSTAFAPAAAITPDKVKAVYTNERGTATTTIPNDFQWTYTVDRFGYQTSSTDPLGHTWTYSRDTNGLTRRMIEPAGAGGTADLGALTTSYRYDDRGNLLRATYAQDQLLGGGKISETWEYDEDFSQVTRHVDARGFETLSELDTYGNVIEVHQQVDIAADPYEDEETPGWITTKFHYTEGGSLTPGEDLPGGLVDLVTDARGIKTRTVYYDNDDEGVEDHEHGLIKTILSGLGSGEEQTGTVDGIVVNAAITHFQYDAARNVNVVIQQMGDLDETENEPEEGDDTDRYTRYEYDQLGRLIEVQLPEADHVDIAGELDRFAPTTTYEYDKEGFVIKQTDALGRYTEYAHDEMGRLKRTTLPESQFYNPTPPGTPTTAKPTIVNTYDDAGNLETVTDANGNTTTYFHNDRNEVTEIHLPATDDHGASITKYAYDSVGNLKSVRDPLDNGGVNGSRETTYVYDSLHRQTKITMPDPDWDILGGTGSTHTAPIVDFVYDDSGNLLSQTNPHEAATGSPPKTEYTYDGLGRRTETKLPSVSYVPSTYTLTTTDPLPTGRPTTGFEYDANGNLVSLTDAEGNETLFEYDSLGRQIKITQEATSQHSAPVTELVYNDASELVLRKDPPVNGGSTVRETTFVYDTLGRQIFVIQPEVDVEGEEDPVAPTTAYLYDGVGNLRFTVDADQVAGHTGATPLDKALDAIADDMATEVVYDELNRQISVIYPLIGLTSSTGTETTGRPTTETAYDKNGNRRMAQDANGNKTVYEYDAQNRVVKVTAPDPDGGGDQVSPVTELHYDAVGNQTSTVQHVKVDGTLQYRQAKVLYDNLNRPYRQTTHVGTVNGTFGDALTKSETTYYVTGLTHESKSFKVASSSTADTTSFQYDDLGRKTSQNVPTQPSQFDTTQFAYDLAGNARRVIDPADNETLLAYDEIFRQIGESTRANISGSPTTINRAMEYDEAGNLVSKTDRNGREIEFEYDQLGRRIKETWLGTAGGGYEANYEYNLAGQLTGASDGNTAHEVLTDIAFALDAMGHPISVQEQLIGIAPSNGAGGSIYDSTLNYGFDASGNRTRTSASINGTADFVNLYGYDPLNRMVSIEQTGPSGSGVNAKTVLYTYQGDSQLDTISRYNSTMAAVIANTAVDVGMSNYNYFANGQLEELEHQNSLNTTQVRYAWTYDDNNRIRNLDITRPTIDTSGLFATHNVYTYDDSGQAIGDGLATTDYVANGNRADSEHTTTKDNRLTSDVFYNYEYDAEGNRTLRTIKPYSKIIDTEFVPTADNITVKKHGYLNNDTTKGFAGSQYVGLTSSGNGATWTITNLPPGTYDVYATWDLTDEEVTGEFVTGTSRTPVASRVHQFVDFEDGSRDDLGAGLGTAWQEIAGDLIVGDDNTVIVTLDGGEVAIDAIQIIRRTADVSATRYEYDYQNRLVSVTNYSDTSATTVLNKADYFYDALGRRVAVKFDDESASYYVFDGQQVVHQFDTAGALEQRVLWGVKGHLVAFEDKSPTSTLATAWALTDQAGSVRDLMGRRASDTLSYLIQTELYNSFGNAIGNAHTWSIATGTPTFSLNLHYFFTGQQWDRLAGLQLSSGEAFDPVTGQFMQQNRRTGDTNPYRRGGNEPNYQVSQAPRIGGGRVELNPVVDWLANRSDNEVYWAWAGGSVVIAATVMVSAPYVLTFEAFVLATEGALIGGGLYAWGQNTAYFDDWRNGRPTNPDNLWYTFDKGINSNYESGMATYMGVGAAMGVGLPALAASTRLYVSAPIIGGLGAYGVYAEGAAAAEAILDGNYFQAGFHAFNAGTVVYGGIRGAHNAWRSVSAQSAYRIPNYQDTARPGWLEPWTPPPRYNGPVNHGRWVNPNGTPGVPNNSLWISTRQSVIDVVGTNSVTGEANPIVFYRGAVDFSPWAVGRPLRVPGLVGTSLNSSADQTLIYAAIAKQESLANPTATVGWLKSHGLTAHHTGGETVILLPRGLHTPNFGGVQHTNVADLPM